MKKILFLFLSVTVILACNSRKYKKQSTTVGLKGFYSYYNTLFNSKEALQTELDNRNKAYKDNFYSPYIRLLTTEDQPLGADISSVPGSMFSDINTAGSGDPGRGSDRSSGNTKGASIPQISEAKALKAIAKYSVLKDGVEKNKKLFGASILLAQARLLQNKPLEALDALNYVFVHMKKNKKLPLARIYQGYAYYKLGDFYKADEIFGDLKQQKIKKKYAKLLYVYYSEMLVDEAKYDEAAEELSQAFKLNKNRKLRSRIAYLRGQILAGQGKMAEARESFSTAYKYASDFEFEVKAQIEIAKTFNKDDSYDDAIRYIRSISKKGTYMSRKNEFYYAMGLIAQKAGKNDEAQEFFRTSTKEKISDPQIRGLAYKEIADDYFAKNDYIPAGAYYDSALAVMTYEPAKNGLISLTKNIKKITQNFYLIKKNDSILRLVNMPEAERQGFFTKYIAQLKAKEDQEEAEKKREERAKGFDTGDYNANSVFASNTGGFQDFSSGKDKGGFYFANKNTVDKGAANFRMVWGNRSLNDNWRYSARAGSIDDEKNKAMGITSVQNPRRFEVSYYTEQLPKTANEIEALKKARDTASLGLGRMYENFFSKTDLATKTLYNLVDNKPEEDIKIQALYQIFAMNYERNSQAAERAKNMILSEFPYTSYAEFVRNPKSSNFSASSEEVEKAYQEAFNLYNEEKYTQSSDLIDKAVAAFPKDALVPKFELLKAFNTGKTAGKEIMILQLEQIALNYPKTQEGQKATEMLKYLKSDLKVEMTDDTGNKLNFSKPLAKPGQNESSQPAMPGDPEIGRPSQEDGDTMEKELRMKREAHGGGKAVSEKK
ncbi:tetratricopeptide repeat protein [Weeksellaceae bacterium A-14]